MKKKLEADLISIAHRILQLKNKSDINQLYSETQKLYEKLAILKFVDENFDTVKPTIGRHEIENNIEAVFEKREIIELETPKVEIETVGIIDEKKVIEETSKSDFEFIDEEIKKEKVVTTGESDVVQISFEDIMGINYSDAQFVKVDEVKTVSTPEITEIKEKKSEKNIKPEITISNAVEPKSVSLNDKLSKGIHIDLNDRLAFIKHLFGNSPEDYNRVYNQLITFDTFAETKEFIEKMVKPDYNNWNGKDDYEQRFIEIIEKKFL